MALQNHGNIISCLKSIRSQSKFDTRGDLEEVDNTALKTKMSMTKCNYSKNICLKSLRSPTYINYLNYAFSMKVKLSFSIRPSSLKGFAFPTNATLQTGPVGCSCFYDRDIGR